MMEPSRGAADGNTGREGDRNAGLRRGVGDVVERNIHALIARRHADERAQGLDERLADRITGFAGNMRFVCLHAVLFAAWVLANTRWVPVPKFDPSLVLLAVFASVEAIFLSMFVLISQNRMAALADKRADLDLQISLLAEHEITRVIALVQQMAHRMGIEEARDPELAELAKDVEPERVLDQMEETERKLAPD